MNYNILLQEVEAHVVLLFAAQPDARLLYHSFLQTKEVADAAKDIATHYQMDERSLFIVCTAAWFCSTGYLQRVGETTETDSAALAETFLKSKAVDEADIAEIKKLITAAKMPQQPFSLPEKILCDACLYYLGTPGFKEKSKLLRKEQEALANVKISAEAWRAEQISLLETHTYHTDYCCLLLNSGKAQNLLQIKNKQVQKLSAVTDNSIENNTADIQQDAHTTAYIKPAGTRNKNPEKGVETMFRIAATNNVRVSAMADKKASIMITVNAIIISVMLSFMAKNIQEYRIFLAPTILLLLVSVFTIIYAVLATMPRISDGVFTKEQVEKKSVNLLYFGSYYNMGFDEYNNGLKAVMKDSEFLYGSLTKDIFWQGKVLGRKYRLLRIAYNIFMYGLSASVLAFAAAMFLG